MTKGEKMAEQITDFVNGAREKDYEDFAKAMVKQHPTLQQSFTRLVYEFLEKQADNVLFDLRNQSSVEFAKAVRKYVSADKKRFPYI